MSAIPASSRVNLNELERRLGQVPAALSALGSDISPPLPAAFARLERFEVSGIGASEGPARLLVALLHELSIHARFAPAVEYMQRRGDDRTGLIVFSQGLSPNACLTLNQRGNYGGTVLFSAALHHAQGAKRERLDALQAAGASIWTHPPESEEGSLLRLLGPACALASALHFTVALAQLRNLELPRWAPDLVHLPEAVTRALTQPAVELDGDPLAILTASVPSDLGRALAFKWQEALLVSLPPSFDVLSFAHGPAQSLHRSPGTFVLCKSHGTATDEELASRLRELLSPERHRLVELTTRLGGPPGWLELHARLDRLLLAEMRSREVDPARWPLQGRDAPLYGLGG
jgi:creatinine amidohydrolase